MNRLSHSTVFASHSYRNISNGYHKDETAGTRTKKGHFLLKFEISRDDSCPLEDIARRGSEGTV